MAPDDITIAAQGQTRNLLYKRRDGEWTVETYWKPRNFRFDLPHRPLTMPCRPICGKDLKRPHVTCVTSCQIRRVWYGKLQANRPLERVLFIAVNKNRNHAALKDLVMKYVLSLVENLLCN